MPGQTAESGAQAPGARVLLGSGDADALDRIGRVLRAEGHTVIATPRGPRVLYRALGEHFDVAIVDLELDDLDGFETLQILKRARPDLPVLVLSGPTPERTTRAIAAEGVVRHLRKPVDVEILIACVGGRGETASPGANAWTKGVDGR